jgi:putative hydrolase of the HAD superfamily
MKKIKLISFDMWGTLLISNPKFREQRAKVIAESSGLHIDTVHEAFNAVKHDADLSVEKFGIQFSSNCLYEKIAHILNINSHLLLKLKCEEIFLDNLPILMDDTIEILSKLKEDGYTLVLSSNTLLIEGKVITQALKKLKISEYFSAMHFSDQLDVSKPNPLFYKAVQEESLYLKSQIVHVGDNLNTDIIGSQEYGFTSYHITKLYNTTLTSFYNSLNK